MQADRPKGVTAAPIAVVSAGSTRDLKLRDRTALVALLLGVGLLWPLPLGGIVLMVAGAFGLAISWEDQLVEVRLTPPAPPPREGP